MRRHYLDHASTVPLRPEAAEGLAAWMALEAGDPGRLHAEGRGVRDAVETAREQLAAFLGVRGRQVVFTSGATEAVHAAVWGATRRRPGASIVCAAVEHSAVRAASARWAPVVEPAVDGLGRIDVGAVEAALASGDTPALVHCQWANHEVGTVQPVAAVVAAARAAGVLVHVDAAAAAGHLPLELTGEGAPDLLSLSGHKLGAPPGIGALVVAPGLRLEPLLVGGDQERGRRAGMENVGGIVGLGAVAAALSPDRVAAEAAANRRQTDALGAAATAEGDVVVVGDPAGRVPHIVCLGVVGVEAEPVLLGLDRAGIAAHSGSACASESLEPSPVLAAMGADPSHSLRLSVGWSTTDEDVEAFARAFGPVVGALRALRT